MNTNYMYRMKLCEDIYTYLIRKSNIIICKVFDKRQGSQDLYPTQSLRSSSRLDLFSEVCYNFQLYPTSFWFILGQFV